MPKPITGRHAEAVFLLLQNGFRQELLERFLEDIALLHASDLEGSWNSTGQLRQGAIQIGIKNLHAGRSRRLIDFEEVVVRNAHLKIHIQQTIEGLSRACVPVVVFRHSQSKTRLDLSAEIVLEKVGGKSAQK